MDYKEKKYESYLSRARVVILTIEGLLLEDEPNLKLSKLSIPESRTKFAIGFDKLCIWLSPSLSALEVDVRHNRDAMYVSVYYRILRQRKKKKLAESQPSV